MRNLLPRLRDLIWLVAGIAVLALLALAFFEGRPTGVPFTILDLEAADARVEPGGRLALRLRATVHRDDCGATMTQYVLGAGDEIQRLDAAVPVPPLKTGEHAFAFAIRLPADFAPGPYWYHLVSEHACPDRRYVVASHRVPFRIGGA